jgi:hypothetical protein
MSSGEDNTISVNNLYASAVSAARRLAEEQAK